MSLNKKKTEKKRKRRVREAGLRDDALRIAHEILGPLLTKVEASALKLLARKLSAEQVKERLLKQFEFLAAGG